MIIDVSQLFLAQFILGVGSGLCYPGWMAIFTKFTDKGREGYSWSLYNTYTTISIALAAIIGAYVAQNFGFHAVFCLMFVFSLLSTFLILNMHKYIEK
ncbi:MAG: MFS transporter [Minisyncoccia bacterium]